MNIYATYAEQRAKKVLSALQRNGFKALYFADKNDAVREVLAQIPLGNTVGIGGSVTVRSLGIADALRKRGQTVFDHWIPGLTDEQRAEVRRAQLTADIFLAGCNAITLDGHLVNVDGIGNRVAPMIFGPRKVILVAGINKVVKDLSAALDRIKNQAAPLNAVRLNYPSPCGKTGYCTDCAGPGRMCRVTSIIEARPDGILDYTIILIGENLGF
ncbi:lactate utilization protein [Thermodesulfitimonas autotrophica]|uniref:lactate utilization protein n=1 Tax=Thermodesulfitimonas autotrophica TaxID=1894989 RepID=UPI002FE0060C